MLSAYRCVFQHRSLHDSADHFERADVKGGYGEPVLENIFEEEARFSNKHKSTIGFIAAQILKEKEGTTHLRKWQNCYVRVVELETVRSLTSRRSRVIHEERSARPAWRGEQDRQIDPFR